MSKIRSWFEIGDRTQAPPKGDTMKSFEEWWDENCDECWISYHESGACYDTDYDDFVDHMYERYFERYVCGRDDQATSWDNDTHSGGGTDRLSNACGASHRSR